MKLKYFDIAANAPKIPAADNDNIYPLCHTLTPTLNTLDIIK